MPNINLYYIENISETDIPYFPSIEAMNSFMNAHLLTNATGEENYYVPYYRNVIKMSKDTFNYDTHSCNYLSLYINGRTYYYFIDSIDYVNEDCYAINIHMDTIMSFYWQIGVSACMIERKFINRWGDNATPAINRNYIRENYSNGNYKVVSNDIISSVQNRNRWVTIALMNRFDDWPAQPGQPARIARNWSRPLMQELIDKDGNECFTQPQVSKKSGWMLWSFYNCNHDLYWDEQEQEYKLYPSSHNQMVYYYDSYTYTQEITGQRPEDFPATEQVPAGRMDNLINHIYRDPYVKDIFVIPFIPFSKDVRLDAYNPGKVIIDPQYMNIGGYHEEDHGMPTDKKLLTYGIPKGIIAPIYDYVPGQSSDDNNLKAAHQSPLKPIRSVVHNELYGGSIFSKNSSIGVTFSKDYCPQLFDTNYIQITFGTIYANTTYPIEYLTDDRVYGKFYADCFTGKRYYYITDTANNYQDDYRTIVCDDNILTIEMDNDPWKQYEANNKSRWATIGVQAGVNAVKDLIGVAGIVGGLGAIGDAANLKKYMIDRDMDKRKKKAKDIGKARIALTEVERKEDMRTSAVRGISTGVGLLDSAGAVVNQLQTEYNLQHSPQSVIRGGDATSVVTDNGWAIRWIRWDCENIEQVAQVYHRIGYLVNEYYPEAAKLTDLLSYCNTRYYFNIIKLGECAVHINNRIENEDITLDIKYRLQQGIRYWNISVTNFELCNFKYDNVELDYLP